MTRRVLRGIGITAALTVWAALVYAVAYVYGAPA